MFLLGPLGVESLRSRLERKRLWTCSSFPSGSPPLPLAVEAMVVTCLLTYPPNLFPPILPCHSHTGALVPASALCQPARSGCGSGPSGCCGRDSPSTLAAQTLALGSQALKGSHFYRPGVL